MPGIDRPAIASFFPTLRGGERDARPRRQSAVRRRQPGRSSPSWATSSPAPCWACWSPPSGCSMSDRRTSRATRRCARPHAVLRDANCRAVSTASSKATTSPSGTVDVVVTDGFTGNIALKTIEGTVKLYGEFLRADLQQLDAGARSAICWPGRRCDTLRARTDPRRYNGAIFLGLNGIAVKSHGGTDALRLRQCHRRRGRHGRCTAPSRRSARTSPV